MNNSDVIKLYQNYKRQCANLLDISAMYYNYDAKNIKGSHEELRKELKKELCDIDFRGFTPESLTKDLGFGYWDETLILCPIWTRDLIKNGTELYTIGNKCIIVGVDKLDNDVRFGCFAHGFKLNQLRDYRLKNIIE